MEILNYNSTYRFDLIKIVDRSCARDVLFSNSRAIVIVEKENIITCDTRTKKSLPRVLARKIETKNFSWIIFLVDRKKKV